VGYRFDVSPFGDQHRRMCMAEVVGAYRDEAGFAGGQANGFADNVCVLKPPKRFKLICVECSS